MVTPEDSELLVPLYMNTYIQATSAIVHIETFTENNSMRTIVVPDREDNNGTNCRQFTTN